MPISRQAPEGDSPRRYILDDAERPFSPQVGDIREH